MLVELRPLTHADAEAHCAGEDELTVRWLTGGFGDAGVGTRAALRIEPENTASVRVAEKAGFEHVTEFVSATDTDAEGQPVTFALYLLDLPSPTLTL